MTPKLDKDRQRDRDRERDIERESLDSNQINQIVLELQHPYSMSGRDMS